MTSEEANERKTQQEIKAAVAGEQEEQDLAGVGEVYAGNPYASDQAGYENMQPSIMNSPAQEGYAEQGEYENYVNSQENVQQPEQQVGQGYEQQQVEAGYSGGYQQDYNQGYAQGYTGNLSSDTITEISEQIVDEKLVNLKKDLRKVIDLKEMMDSRVVVLDERLKKIEKIIDTLQVSILQKVGDYVNNVEDLKKELVETQKSFKVISKSKKK